MPFKSLTPNDPTGVLRRVALMGPPNSWKSATLVSDTPTPRRIVSIPGEKGWETLRQAPDTIVDVWELGDLSAASPHQVVREIDEHVNRVISDIVAKKDPTVFLGLDGLHKLYGWIYKQERLNMESWPSAAKMGADTLDLRAYQYAHDGFQSRLTKWLSSRVPYIWVTFWEGASKDDPADSKSASHIFPDLPGQAARWIVGEFSAVLYHDVARVPIMVGGKPVVKAEWVLRPEGKIWGVGIKGAPALMATLPARVPISFKGLAKLLGEVEG